MKLSKLSRLAHRWGSPFIAIPVAIMIVTGVILQFKKEAAWIQPPTQIGTSQELAISLDRVLQITKSVPEANVSSWQDIDRLDVRPSKGVVKVRCTNRWEIQIDTLTGDVVQVAFRRSDLIESIHDGSFFHDRVTLWVFLPSALLLGLLWLTGVYLYFLPYWTKWKRRT